MTTSSENPLQSPRSGAGRSSTGLAADAAVVQQELGFEQRPRSGVGKRSLAPANSTKDRNPLLGHGVESKTHGRDGGVKVKAQPKVDHITHDSTAPIATDILSSTGGGNAPPRVRRFTDHRGTSIPNSKVTCCTALCGPVTALCASDLTAAIHLRSAHRSGGHADHAGVAGNIQRPGHADVPSCTLAAALPHTSQVVRLTSFSLLPRYCRRGNARASIGQRFRRRWQSYQYTGRVQAGRDR